jgi:hypothetical protein
MGKTRQSPAQGLLTTVVAMDRRTPDIVKKLCLFRREQVYFGVPMV